MGKSICQKNFEVKCKEDLYDTVLVKIGQDYHGCSQYEHHTPFGLCKNLDEFTRYLNMLSVEEIINYRDDFDGCILRDMALCNLPISYFDVVLSYINEENFVKLLKKRDRGDDYVISNARNLELFKYLASFTGINEDLLRKISQRCPNSILDYFAEIINDQIII